MSQKHLEGLLKGLLGMALNEKIDDRESGSKKNGFVDRNNCHIKFVQGQNSQSPHIHSERNEKSKSLQQKDLSRNKVLGAKNVKSIRSDESLVDRKRKKLTKPCKTVVSANTVSEKNDISKNVDEIQTNTGLLEYVQCCTEKCRKENLDDNVKKKKKIADEIQLNKNKRRQTVTVTGVRNAQLICIKDEDSIVENNGKGRSTKYDRNNNLTLAKTKGMMDAGGKAIKAPSKLSRVPRKDLKQLAFIPKMEALNVIQYKLKYSEYVKGNAMYRKSSCKQPWVIVNSLSECLLNNMLLSIAKEIQVDDILKKLYESEFQ